MMEGAVADCISSADAEIVQARPIRLAQISAFGFMLVTSRLGDEKWVV